MTFFNTLKNFFSTLFLIIGNFALWLCILIAIFKGINFLNTERYQPNDIPNAKFQVVTLTADNQAQPIYFKDLNNQPLAIDTDNDIKGEDYFLKQNDIYLYHNEGALWNTESKYKIVNGKVQPVSFLFFTFVQAFEIFFLSFIGYAIAKYALLRIWYRRLPDKVRELNQKNIRKLKGFLIFIGLVMGIYAVMTFLNR